MRGTIHVHRYMDQKADWRERHHRMLEWLYLKEYWRASDKDKDKVLRLYGDPLREALEKHRKAKRGKLVY